MRFLGTEIMATGNANLDHIVQHTELEKTERLLRTLLLFKIQHVKLKANNHRHTTTNCS